MRIRYLLEDSVTGKLIGGAGLDGQRGKFSFRESSGDRILGRVIAVLAELV